ncbi:MAG: TDT family transporter [Lachnospiraceae bacterium]
MLKRLEKMPVPILATMVGAVTLSNFMNGLGYAWIRHITTWAAMIIWAFYIIKIIIYPQVCKKEYDLAIPRSLYAAFTMIMMLASAYLFDYTPNFAKILWFVAIIIQACHILYFTYLTVLKNFKWENMMPSWYVTYNGIMVSVVVGGVMKEPVITKIITYYGIAIYFILLPFMIYRLMTKPIADGVYHTQAVLLAPCSLCLVSYLNTAKNPNEILVSVLYFCVLASFLFILIKLPKFFSFKFYPGFAGLTFPMAIGTVAGSKMAGYLTNIGKESLAGIVTQIDGIQFYITTMIIGYVLLKFVAMLCKVPERA